MPLYKYLAALLDKGNALATSETCCCGDIDGCCCLPGQLQATVTSKAACEQQGGTWTRRTNPEVPCPECDVIGCCCLPGAQDAFESTRGDCLADTSAGGRWTPKNENGGCDECPVSIGCCCLPGADSATITYQEECEAAGGSWTALASGGTCPGCPGCCCYPDEPTASKITKQECLDGGGDWKPSEDPDAPCADCPHIKCCLDDGECVPTQGCDQEPLGPFNGSVTVSWCGVSYTFTPNDLLPETGGFCNWAIGPTEGTPTGYSDASCSSICWFGSSNDMRYEDEEAFLFITNDCITGECPPFAGPCGPCGRLRFVIGCGLRGVLFFEGFGSGQVGYDYASGGAKTWLYAQDQCGQESLTLLNQDNCIFCGTARDACDPDANSAIACPPDERPSFGNAACNVEPTVTLNEAP